MPQISLYIDEATLKKAADAAEARHMSISGWVAEQIRSRLEPSYPVGFDRLFGAITDDDFVEPPELSFDSDAVRAEL